MDERATAGTERADGADGAGDAGDTAEARARPEAQRLPAEERYADELARLHASDDAPRPGGWRLSPRAVRAFVLGDASRGVGRKFYGDDQLVDRAIVSLMGRQGLMLVGEPGTAKSLLSELLAAAASGTSTLVVQGSAGIIEDHLRYGWNYALLLAEGPSEKALVPSPVLTAMRTGAIARLEELTRCAPEVQDALISLMSERTVAVPELGAGADVRAAPGFNVIATANLRDRGVHDLSSALKRRFNFETVDPIDDPEQERLLIEAQLAERVREGGLEARVPMPRADALETLVAVFQDLRFGRTRDGVSVPRPTGVMSTAEAVNVAFAAMMEAAFLEGTPDGAGGRHLARQLRGVVLKDDPKDGEKLDVYVDHVAKSRARERGSAWAEFYAEARRG